MRRFDFFFFLALRNRLLNYEKKIDLLQAQDDILDILECTLCILGQKKKMEHIDMSLVACAKNRSNTQLLSRVSRTSSIGGQVAACRCLRANACSHIGGTRGGEGGSGRKVAMGRRSDPTISVPPSDDELIFVWYDSLMPG